MRLEVTEEDEEDYAVCGEDEADESLLVLYYVDTQVKEEFQSDLELRIQE